MRDSKLFSIFTASVMSIAILTGCGSSAASTETTASSAQGTSQTAVSAVTEQTGAVSDTTSGGGKITIFQNKTEIYDQLVKMAKAYQDETGVEVEVWQISGDDYYQNLKTYMSSESGPTIYTVESAAEIDEMKDYMADLSGLSFLDKESSDLLVKKDDGTVIGIPTTAEGFGLVYNKSLYDPSKITDIDALDTYISDESAKGISGFGLSQEDYFLIGHILNTPFALQSDPAAFCKKVYSGEIKLKDVDEFKQLASLFETIREKEQNPLEISYDNNVGNFATGKTAAIHQGNWCYSMFKDYSVGFDMGMTGLPIDGNTKIAVGVPSVWAINSDADANDQKLAVDFLNWLYTSKTGTDYLLNQFGFVPVIDGMTSDSLDPLSKAVSDAITSDNIIPWTFNTEWPAGIITTDLAPVAQEFFSNRSMTTDEFLNNLNDAFVNAAK